MPNSTLASLTAATAATGGLFYGTQSGADRKFTLTSTGASIIEADNAVTVRSLLNVVYDYGNTGTGTVTLNLNNGITQKAAMTGDITLAAPSNPVEGMEMSVQLTASGGARTITLSSITVPTGVTFTGTVASGSVRRLKLYYSGSAWLLTSNLEFA